MTAPGQSMIMRRYTILFRVGTAVLLILTQLITALPARAAAVIHVAPGGLEGQGCGSGWDNACSLSYALSQAGYGTEVWVRQGTYTTQAQDTPFTIPSGAAVYGGFAGSENSRDERSWTRNPTILSGDIQQDDQPDGSRMEDNSAHVVQLRYSSTATHLDGFVIQGGNAHGLDNNRYGGGVLIQHGSPTLENLVLQFNAAEHGGGAACISRGRPWLINVRFEKNNATAGGGFYASDYCTPIIQGAAFSANQADYGGAIHSHGLALVGNASISGNTARLRGGGIYSADHTLVMLNSIVWGNHQAQANNQIYSTEAPFLYNNIIQGGYSGYSIQDIDPAYVEAPSSGPDGQWGTADDTPGDLDLRYDSPAIDKGQKDIYFSFRLTRDLKNWPRIIDHPRPDTATGSLLDLGGYEAGVIHVRQGASGLADGSSWEDAYPELRDGLRAVKPSNEVWAAAGTYLPGDTRADTFALHNEVGIYGGFAGVESLRSQRNWQANPTILSGELGAPNAADDNAYHVVTGLSVDSTAILDGFTIQGGNANGAQAPLNHGGGIYLENAAPRLAHLVITNNQAVVGGGLYGLSASYQLSQSTLTRNQASFGGGIYQTGSGRPSLVNLLFTGNRATDYAGALFNDGDTAPDLSNIVMAGNQAATAGGVFNSHNSQPTFRNITLAGNPGGAMRTFANGPEITVTLVNLIAWGNGQQPILTYQGSLVIRRSLIEYGCPGAANCDYVMSTNPRLARLPSAGNDQQWGTADDDYGDLRLAPRSQAIDAGDNSAVLPEVTFDPAGSPRFVDDPDVKDTGLGDAPMVDIGAYEANRGQTVTRIDQVKTSPSVVGQEVTIFFNVAGGQTRPSGAVTVQASAGAQTVASCTAPAEQGSCAITFQHSGDYRLKAIFAGDGVNNASESDSVAQRVDPADTLVSLQLSPNPATLGQTVHASFSVAAQAPGAGQPTGSVQVGTAPNSCTATLQQGGCDLPLADTGVYSVTAQYSGDGDFNGSPSLPVTLQVSPASTLTEILSVEPNPSFVGQEVTIRFRVTTPTGTPWGSVTVSDGQSECSAAATDGQCTIIFDTSGTHTLTASYEEDYQPANSVSAPVTHQVNAINTATTLRVAKSAGVAVGEPVHADVTLQVLGTVVSPPAGEIEIGDGSIGCLAVVGGSGCDLVFKQPGSYTLRAHYRGKGPFAASTSGPVTVMVGYSVFIPVIGR